MTEIHSLWGRPLEQYATIYGHDSPRHDVSRSLIPEHLSGIKGRDAMAGMRRGEIVTLDMLRSVLLLSRSPSTFREFNDPYLVSACLRSVPRVKSISNLSVSFFGLLPDIYTDPMPSPFNSNTDICALESLESLLEFAC